MTSLGAFGFHPNMAGFDCPDLAKVLFNSVKSSSPGICQHVDMFYIYSSFYWHLNKCPFANNFNFELYLPNEASQQPF